jgi:hypothetical protein
MKNLYDTVHQKGEGVFSKIHILDSTDQHDIEANIRRYRIYHSEGYCFEIAKCYDPIENFYTFDSNRFDGFKKVKDEEHAICLIEDFI